MKRISSTLGRADPNQLMAQYVSYWPAVRTINGRLPPDAKLLLVAESRSLYLDRDVVVEDPFHTPLLVELAEAATDAPALRDELNRRGITHLLYNQHEARRMAISAGRSDYFAEASPVARLRLKTFFAACLEPIANDEPTKLFELANSCRADREGLESGLGLSAP